MIGVTGVNRNFYFAGSKYDIILIKKKLMAKNNQWILT
jgi:hypothetical protein